MCSTLNFSRQLFYQDTNKDGFKNWNKDHACNTICVKMIPAELIKVDTERRLEIATGKVIVKESKHKM